MKSYTDLEQSKKLAEILPIESADMYYFTIIRDYPYSQGKIKTIAKIMDGSFSSNYDTPCWSLAALLGVLPTTIGNFFEKNALRIRMDKGENDFNIWYENFDCGDVAEGLDVREGNPIDACYEMIVKLHEQNLL